MLPNNETQYVGVKPEPNLAPAYVFVDRIFIQSRKKALDNEIIAVAIASPSKTSDEKSAITVHAEHLLGFTVSIVIPYELRNAQPPVFDQPIYYETDPQIFKTGTNL